jgi:hypothetical protein
MNTETRFTKIKLDASRVRLEYETVREGGDPDEYSMLCAERPRAEFGTALQALAADVVEICELAADDLAKITIKGVTLTHTNDILGAVITATKALKGSNAPLLLNTPHLPEEAYSGQASDPNPTMPLGMATRLKRLVEEAGAYVRGSRAQGSLFPAEGRQTASAEVLEAAARLGELSGPGGSCTITGPDGLSVELNADTAKRHRAAARSARTATSH